MKRASVAVAPLVIALLAGCGSTSKTTSSSTGSAVASTPAQSTSTPAQTTTAPATTTAQTSSTASAAGAITVTSKQTTLGPILAAGPKKLTVYMFAADTIPTMSVCGPNCASVWPPVTTRARPQTGGQAVASDLTTITRPDGHKQVTYKGHPLYYFAKDGDAGDAYGQGITSFGAAWYVLSPSGNKIDKS